MESLLLRLLGRVRALLLGALGFALALVVARLLRIVFGVGLGCILLFGVATRVTRLAGGLLFFVLQHNC